MSLNFRTGYYRCYTKQRGIEGAAGWREEGRGKKLGESFDLIAWRK